MVSLCPWSRAIIPAIFKRFKVPIPRKGFQYVPNWYLPVHLGGFGLSAALCPPEGFKVTRQQRHLAAMFLADQKLALYTSMGGRLPLDLIGKAARKFRMLPDLPWSDVIRQGSEEREINPDDPWLERLALYARYCTTVYELRAPKIVHIRPSYRLKPVNCETLTKYWRVRFFGTRVPEVPSLNDLSLKLKQKDTWFGFTKPMGFTSLN